MLSSGGSSRDTVILSEERESACDLAIVQALGAFEAGIEALKSRLPYGPYRKLVDGLAEIAKRYAFITAYSGVWIDSPEYGERVAEMLEGEESIFDDIEVGSLNGLYRVYYDDESRRRDHYEKGLCKDS